MSELTDQYIGKDDIGKNLYRKKTYYTLCIEQDVLAKNQEEADTKLSDCGIDYSKINKDLAEEKNGVETYMTDANYTDSDKTEYVAKLVDEEDDGWEDEKETGDGELDTYALEDDTIDPETGECMSKPLDDLKVALNQWQSDTEYYYS